jgi:transcriptional regulator with XRE-family HTH domain
MPIITAEDLQMNPGLIIHNQRRKKKMTMVALAEASSVHRITLWRIERDPGYNAGWHTIVTILNTLGVDIAYQLRERESKE